MNKRLFYILMILPLFSFSQGEIFRYAQEVARQQKVTAPSLLPPPNNSNTNSELITGNAASFPPGETNGIAGITPIGPAEVTITSELVDDGYQGDYVVKVFAGTYNGGYGRAEHQNVTVSSSTTYEYVLLYRHSGTSPSSGRFKVDGITTVEEVNGLSATTWTELSGTFSTGVSDTTATFEIWCHRPFTSADGTEWIEYKLTVKAQ
ncbi:hypothetical protein [Flagellimonas sp.]|uniref:hypothetical protein n=1 Tax=Flagellimonas sp. TaxID=2058762 RepID=UPI003BA92D8F